MQWRCVFMVEWVLLMGWPGLQRPAVATDERPDVGHNEDVHPNTLMESTRDVLDFGDSDLDEGRNWDPDWPPRSSLQENRPRLPPDALPILPESVPAVDNDDDNNNHNKTTDSQNAPYARCGEYSSRLTANRQCHLVATLPPVPVGASQKRCPDMFRCTDDISHWLQENQERKEQLEELTETMSELQEELRNHRHRVKALDTQNERRSASLNATTLDRRLRFLEARHAEADALLHVHASLLFELQVQLRNLSATVQQQQQQQQGPGGCGVIKRPSLLGMRDFLPPGGQFLSLCQTDCASLYHSGVRHSGVYNVVLLPGERLPVYCDMETDGGAWTVLQQRRDGSVSFNRGWADYRDGFGDPRGEHWLGNQAIHLLSNHGHYSLRIELQDWSRERRHASYHTFRVENEENRYRLHVSGFSGTVEDSFGWYHNRRAFSTPDTGNICAEISHAGWWFHQCFSANLNGVYYKGGRYSLKAQNLLGPDGIVWFSWKNSDFYSLKAVTMMIRPRNFRPRLSP